MSRVKLISAKPEEFVVNFHGDIGVGRGYESDVKFTEEYGKWSAEVTIGEMPDQETINEAADKLSKYLLAMSKAVKAKNIKHLNLGSLFDSVSK